MALLRSYLTGDAAALVEAFPIDGAYYTAAVNLLKSVYDRPEREAQEHWFKLLQIQGTSKDDPADLRRTLTETDRHLMALEAIGEVGPDGEGAGNFLPVFWISKFSPAMRLKWEDEKSAALKEATGSGPEAASGGQTKWSAGEQLTRMRAFLHARVRAVENAAALDMAGAPKRSTGGGGFRAPAVAALSTQAVGSVGATQAAGPRGRPPCTLCDADHWTARCPTFNQSATVAMGLLRRSRACFRCGHRGHQAVKCVWQGVCEKCRGRHHRMWCIPREKHERKEKVETPAVAKCALVGGRSLMRTMPVVANGVSVRSMADSGAGRTFIDLKLVAEHGWKPVRHETLSVEGILSSSTTARFPIYDVEVTAGPVSVKSAMIGFDDPVSYCSQLCPQGADELRRQGVWPLADVMTTTSPQDVSIILGDDIVDLLVPGPTKRLESGLKATWSVVGWVIHGDAGQVCVVKCLRAAVKEDLDRFWSLEHLGIVEEVQDDGELRVLESLSRDPDGRYRVDWPLKTGMLPGRNRKHAEVRLSRMEAKLTSDEAERYDEHIQGLVQQGHLEEAPIGSDDSAVTYLPHRPVIKEGKVRLVVDPSTGEKGEWALNECLLEGPTALPRIPGVLMRFRTGQFAMTGDLQQAFLQIGLHESSRDRVRVLWRHQELRFTAVAFGLRSSPGILQTVLNYHLDNERERLGTAMKLKASMYVDDVVHSNISAVEVSKFAEEASGIFDDARMSMHKVQMSTDRRADSKVLGLVWTQDDALQVQFPAGAGGARTKRELAGVVGRIYDPLGLLAPGVHAVRVLLQDEGDRGRDDALSDEGAKVLADWADDAEGSAIKVSRWIGFSGSQGELHVFVDASIRMYAACVYLRIDGTVHLLFAKARLVPKEMVKKGFSPRLELLACLLGSKISDYVKGELSQQMGITKEVGWTDSTCCLRWLRGRRSKWDVFVRNRVDQIQASAIEFRHVAGKENPADLPTRGVRPSELQGRTEWFTGPEWLAQSEENWPVEDKNLLTEDTEQMIVAAVKPGIDVVMEMVEPSVSRWKVLTGAVSRIKKWAGKQEQEVSEVDRRGAEKLIFAQVQKNLFGAELRRLRQGDPVERASKLASLKPFLDENGLIRLGGRLQEACLSWDQKHPVVLPRCGAVDLLLMSVHETGMHCGTRIMVSLLRAAGVHVLQGKRSAQRVWRHCRKCSRFLAGPGGEETPPLPRDRVTFTRAFDVTGVDLAGPLYLSDGSKLWIVLLTCMSVRAVHFEVVAGLDTGATLRALTRFAAVRGWPSKFMSDHGTNFVAVAKKVPAAWEFMVEKGPWWGGAWERLIGVTTSLLKRTLGRNNVGSAEEMETQLKRVEGVLNHRPICPEGGDDEGAPTALTPMMFLRPPGKLDVELRDSWHADMGRKWRDEYLVGVLGAGKAEIWKKRGQRVREGQVVLVEKEGAKRVLWPLGRVIRLIRSQDGGHRVAEVRMERGVLRRPVQKLYPLEIEDSAHAQGEKQEPEEVRGEIEEPTGGRDEAVQREVQAVQEEAIEAIRTRESRSGRTVRRPQWAKDYDME